MGQILPEGHAWLPTRVTHLGLAWGRTGRRAEMLRLFFTDGVLKERANAVEQAVRTAFFRVFLNLEPR